MDFSTGKISDKLTSEKMLQGLSSFSDDYSKPSSISTAYTKATTVYDYKPSKKETQGKKKAKQNKKGVCGRFSGIFDFNGVGQKRPAQTRLDTMEFMTRLPTPSERLVMSLKLTCKKTGKTYDFPIYNQEDIKGFKNSALLRDLDMSKLEVEYDYDTDSEQLIHCKSMLMRELQEAIDFFVKEDPIKLTENVMLKLNY